MKTKFTGLIFIICLNSSALVSQPSPGGRFGIHIDLSPKSIEFAHDLGVDWLRLQGSNITTWEKVEPTKGSFVLNDSLVASLRQQNFNLLGNLYLTPTWASSDPTAASYPNVSQYFGPHAYIAKEINDWSNYVQFVLQRWGKFIYAWEIWNEPDIHFLVSDSSGKIDNYNKLVKAVEDVSKTLSGANVFVGPVLAYYLTSDSFKPPGKFPPDQYKRYRDVNFVKDFFEKGNFAPFRIFSFHHYSDPQHPLPSREIIKAKVRYIYDKLPLIQSVWVTEYNYEEKFSLDDTLKQQEIGKNIVRDHLSLLSSGIEKVFLYNAIDKPYGSNVTSNFIIDGKRTKIADIYSVMTHIINNTTSSEPIGMKENKGWVEYTFHVPDGHLLVIPVAESTDVDYTVRKKAEVIAFDGKSFSANKGTNIRIPKGNYYYIKYLSE